MRKNKKRQWRVEDETAACNQIIIVHDKHDGNLIPTKCRVDKDIIFKMFQLHPLGASTEGPVDTTS